MPKPQQLSDAEKLLATEASNVDGKDRRRIAAQVEQVLAGNKDKKAILEEIGYAIAGTRTKLKQGYGVNNLLANVNQGLRNKQVNKTIKLDD